jgi:hypothetical protein
MSANSERSESLVLRASEVLLQDSAGAARERAREFRKPLARTLESTTTSRKIRLTPAPTSWLLIQSESPSWGILSTRSLLEIKTPHAELHVHRQSNQFAGHPLAPWENPLNDF